MFTFPITQKKLSRLNTLQLATLQSKDFGKYFTDHMFIAQYENNVWKNPRIEPYQKLAFAPSLSALHYGQAIFEGMKAHRLHNGKIGVFRIQDHYKRLNLSAERLCMPGVPETFFQEGILQLIQLDKNWVGEEEGAGLYIRPFLFASDEQIMAAPSSTYQFSILATPILPYFTQPIDILAEDTFSRAAQGGVGFAKAAGNYAAGFMPTKLAQEKGFAQVLWLDADTHTLVQECGVMNIMFLIGDEYVTPPTENKMILSGITRDSALQILQEKGMKVSIRDIRIQELIDAHKKGTLKEIFGLGTAATLSFIHSITYKDTKIISQDTHFPAATQLKEWINAARTGHKVAECCTHWISSIS